MVALVGALGIVYGCSWFVRQIPKIGVMTTGFLLVREKEKTSFYKRAAKLGFDIHRDIEFLTGKVEEIEFTKIQFKQGTLHKRLRFLEKYTLFLKEDEVFILDQAMRAIQENRDISGDEFKRLISISEARLSDKEFMSSFQ